MYPRVSQPNSIDHIQSRLFAYRVIDEGKLQHSPFWKELGGRTVVSALLHIFRICLREHECSIPLVGRMDAMELNEIQIIWKSSSNRNDQKHVRPSFPIVYTNLVRKGFYQQS